MFAYEIPGSRFSLPAAAAVERYHFVSVDANSNGVTATATTAIVGVSMNKAAANEVLEVADGIVMVEAGAAITAGVAVTSNATGQAVAGEGPAIALTAATAAGEIITVKI